MNITLYHFDITFLKLLLKTTLYGLLQGKICILFSTIVKENDHVFSILMQSPYPSF